MAVSFFLLIYVPALFLPGLIGQRYDRSPGIPSCTWHGYWEQIQRRSQRASFYLHYRAASEEIMLFRATIYRRVVVGQVQFHPPERRDVQGNQGGCYAGQSHHADQHANPPTSQRCDDARRHADRAPVWIGCWFRLFSLFFTIRYTNGCNP